MERRNIMMDADTWDAANYLAVHSAHQSASAAIRLAVQNEARRKGWKPQRAREFLERRTRRQPADAGETGGRR